LDAQARAVILRNTAKYFFSMAKFNATALTEDIPHTEEKNKQYFDDNLETSKVDERMVLDCVEFSKDAFAKRIPEPTCIDLQKVYDSHKNQFDI
jgi:hypothetical protein